MTFKELGLSDPLLSAIEDAGYETPTPIQEKAIPVVFMNRDVLGCAQTGTGKTAGFVLPMIDILDAGRPKARMPRSLILEPTRELAAQVAENFENYGKNHKLTHALLIGGESFVEQQKVLERGVDVLIATPGRLLDLFERGKILLSDVKILVIDEADRMLDMGFIPDVEEICSKLPMTRQTLFFSATMPPEIKRLADKFLSNPKEITVARPATTASTIEDFLTVVHPRDKRDTLRALLRAEEIQTALVFCNRKRDVDVVARSLKNHEFNAAALHGDMTQDKRTETLDKFRKGEIQILVASDVAARGLDIDDVSHVFNFDVPFNPDDYVHRIGRTGRAGRSGRAFTLGTRDDDKLIAGVERVIGRKITRLDDAKSPPAKKQEPEEKPQQGRNNRNEGRSQARKDERTESRGNNRSRQGRDGGRNNDARTNDTRGNDGRSNDGRSGDTRGGDGRSNERRNNRGRRGRDEDIPPLPDTNDAFGQTDQVPAFLLRGPSAQSEKEAA